MYNKLFTKILDSSIWLESDATRLVWITCLAAMDEDGFCAFASVGNLSHRARVSDEAGADAITRLEGPDPNSSDPSHDGRRLERVPGGWMVFNADKYRALATRAVAREQTKERVRRFRSKRQPAPSADDAPASRRDDTTERRDDVTPLTCATCGVETTVPFAPDPDRPIYCRTCYADQKPVRTEKEAVYIRAQVWGRCPHEPACADYQACIELLRRERPSLAASARAAGE